MKLFIPPQSSFAVDDADGTDFQEAPALEWLARQLVNEKWPTKLGFLTDARICVLWKRKGGNSGHRMTLGKCQKASGLLGHFSRTDFIIWLAADNCEANHFNERQIEATLFHEMLHCGQEADDAGNKKWTTVGHDVEMFVDEVRAYGAWKEDLRRLRQLSFEDVPEASVVEDGEDPPLPQIVVDSLRQLVAIGVTVIDSGSVEPHTHRHSDRNGPAMVCTDRECTLEPKYALVQR